MTRLKWFQQFLIYNICADYHIANLTLLATGLAWFVTIHRPLELAIGSQVESSASQQTVFLIILNMKFELS